MDPLSVAGLGIGVASLAFQAFAGCIKGFVLLSAAHNFDQNSSTLLCLLNLQELQLTEWARRAGLLKDPPKLDTRLNELMVRAVLQQLQALLSDTDKLQSRYKMSFKTPPGATQEDVAENTNTKTNERDEGILRSTVSNTLRREIMHRAGIISDRGSLPKRLWWAAVDRGKFQELIETIRTFIVELWKLFDPIRQDQMLQHMQIVLSHVISTSERMDELTTLKDALQHTSSAIDQSSSNSALASAAGVKSLMISMRSNTTNIVRSTMNRPPKDGHTFESSLPPFQELDMALIKNFKPIKHCANIGIADMNGRSVLVECKDMSRQFRAKMIERARDLAYLLSAPKDESFRSLRCEGLTRDNDDAKIAFVFTLPHAQPNGPLQSLRSLFGLSPSVTERIKLALQLTKSLDYLHTAGWLHKDLRSENILFLPTNQSSTVANPVIAGFAFARLDSPCAISEQPSADPQHDIYRHPEAMGEPSTSFTASKDIYSLGCILLEIGEWRSLRSLVENVVKVAKPNVSLMELARVRPFLLDDGPKGGLGMLRYRMGDMFAATTKMMLSGSIPVQWQVADDETALHRPGVLNVAIRELGRCLI
ncbi:MAG: hypothetical protein LQ342_002294 [Letrouitia transgressa]|nr:MAG: hypothetical protein LQ342_002294 [Letrouitia transgressa]